jgi:tRNA wybutosine-synthesizing protein 1
VTNNNELFIVWHWSKVECKRIRCIYRVEIKGVTCYGSTSTLTIENVPWHHDKVFAEALVERTKGEYEISCEHGNSSCVFLANVDKFKVQGQ